MLDTIAQVDTATQTKPTATLPDLNKVSAKIEGDTVLISALLDLEGLDILEKKIAALKAFLSD